VRVPFANVGAIKLPDEISDDDAILLADIFPTGYMGAELAEITPGDTVAVFGCGPAGQFAIAAAKLMDAGRIFAIDYEPSRLDMAQAQGAETIDFESENPVEALRDLTGGIGPDRAIDAVGVDVVMPHRGPGAPSRQERRQFEAERDQVAPAARTKGKDWASGDAPSQVLSWAVQSLAKAGTLAIIGVYPSSARTFPIGDAMNKNLTVKMGNCDHRKYIPRLIQLVRTGAVTPSNVLTAREPLMSALEAYQAFDKRQPGWIKVELVPQLSPAHG
jgi:threonine dehydrogenase-like Zn-dependent dehydrogenase